ncbi:MAG: CRISPR-associated endonuclease Cas1 [Exilibacterium sp.]
MELAKTCLVIDARKLQSLDLDGPALRIRVYSQCSRLFPLRRLSRIHVLGGLEQGFQALLHCAEKQIPVAFFTARGKLRCQLYFPVYENSIIGHWLEHVDFDIEAKQQYDEWLAHGTLHILSMMGFRRGAREIRQQQVGEKLRSICHQKLGGTAFRDAEAWLQGILSAHLSQLIVRQGLANQSRGKRRLLEDMTRVCELWLLYLLAETVVEGGMRIDAYSMANFYQRHAEQIEYTVRRMLVQLAGRLEAIV